MHLSLMVCNMCLNFRLGISFDSPNSEAVPLLMMCLLIVVAKFSSSGREDVDVRTLGRGRPFMFEIVNSRKVNFTLEELSNIQSKINSKSKDIYVRDLQVVKK